MTDRNRETGVITALLERLEKQRLPRILAIKASLDTGNKLADYEIEYLDEVLADAGRAKDLVDRHPELASLAARVLHLYKEIMDKALENEQASP